MAREWSRTSRNRFGTSPHLSVFESKFGETRGEIMASMGRITHAPTSDKILADSNTSVLGILNDSDGRGGRLVGAALHFVLYTPLTLVSQ